jgi:methylthioribose-1-phosphate isomerase
VRGAPLIGLAAIYGLWLYAGGAEGHQAKQDAILAGAESLKHARPTAVNLAWAVDRALKAVADRANEDAEAVLLALAGTMESEDRLQNRRIGDFGADLFSAPVSVLTHCNTGSLATAGYGTALGIIRSLHRNGHLKAVYADETRPLLQGARLTAWELEQDGIAATVIADSAAAFLMAKGQVDVVVVGADRVTANGDTANKIGTLMLAVLAHHYHIPFLVAAPSSTIDRSLVNGGDIPIEERARVELAEIFGKPLLGDGIGVWNPAFDVTPAHLITAIVTEQGTVYPPYGDALAQMKSN